MTAIVDTWVSSRPHRVHHAWSPLLVGSLYIVFNVVYIVAFDGTDPKGRDYIYPVLKWNESPGEPWRALAHLQKKIKKAALVQLVT